MSEPKFQPAPTYFEWLFSEADKRVREEKDATLANALGCVCAAVETLYDDGQAMRAFFLAWALSILLNDEEKDAVEGIALAVHKHKAKVAASHVAITTPSPN